MGYMSREAHGSSAGLVFYVGMYCAVAVGLVLGFIALFAPTRLSNPGLSAYKPPPRTVIADVPSRPQHPPQPIVLAQEPEPELPSVATTLTTPAPAAAEKPKRAARVEKPRRSRSATPRVRRDPRRDYAYQPFFWGHRPWY